MKLIKTIQNLVMESQRALDEAAEIGVNERELDRLEKNLERSKKLMKLYDSMSKGVSNKK